MKRFLAACLLLAAFVPLSATAARADCMRPNCWGAIAVGTGNGAWAWVVNHPDAGTARRLATAKCNGVCNRVLTFRNSCGAYALAANGGWGWASGYNNRAGAEARALAECAQRNPQGCQIKVWACTSR